MCLVTQVLSVSSVVAVDEEQRVSGVYQGGSCRALWDVAFLAVFGEQEAIYSRETRGIGCWTSNTFGTFNSHQTR